LRCGQWRGRRFSRRCLSAAPKDSGGTQTNNDVARYRGGAPMPGMMSLLVVRRGSRGERREALEEYTLALANYDTTYRAFSARARDSGTAIDTCDLDAEGEAGTGPRCDGAVARGTSRPRLIASRTVSDGSRRTLAFTMRDEEAYHAYPRGL